MDIGSREYQAWEESSKEQRRQQLAIDFKTLMQSEWGRRVAYCAIYEVGGLDQKSFDPDPIKMAYNEGVREGAARFKQLIFEADSGKYMTMVAERVTEQQRDMALQLQSETQYPKGT